MQPKPLKSYKVVDSTTQKVIEYYRTKATAIQDLPKLKKRIHNKNLVIEKNEKQGEG